MIVLRNFDSLKQRARQNEKAARYLDSFANKLATEIFKMRLKRNLTQSTLAELAGVTQKTISRIEAGDPGVKIGTYDKVFEALNVNDYDFQINEEEHTGKEVAHA